MRDVDTIGRLSGDEFTVILEDVKGADEVTAVAEKLRKTLIDPIVVGGREIFVSASIGIALYPENGETVDALLQAADSAMYHAKNLGRNCHALGSSAISAEAGERLRMSALLRRALGARGIPAALPADRRSEDSARRRAGSAGASQLGHGRHGVAGEILAKLPVPVLKIDRSFVSRMLDDSDATALVSTILTLARTLRLRVVAEGVEAEGQETSHRTAANAGPSSVGLSPPLT